MPSFFRVRSVKMAQKYQTPGADVMRKVGDAVLPKIIARTQSGLDENRRRFAPYAKDSKKAGKTVDLTETFDMLSQMTVVKATPKTVRLGWKSRKLGTRAGFLHGGTENMPARPFVGITTQWVIDALRKFYRPFKR